MTVFFLAAVFFFLFVRYLQQKAKAPLDLLDEAVVKWKTNRMEIIGTLRQSADLLKCSHKQKAETEQTSAKKNLVGDLVSLGGVLLAPFSGGLSLVATGVSVLTSVESYLTNRAASKQHDENAEKIILKVKEAEEQDKAASGELNEMLGTLDYLEEQLSIMEIDNIMASVKGSMLPTSEQIEKEATQNISDILNSDLDLNEAALPTSDEKHTEEKIDWTRNETENLDSHVHRKNELPMPYGLALPKQVAHLNAVLNGGEHVMTTTQITKEVSNQSESIKKVTSLAKSVQNVSKKSKSVSKAKQAGAVIKTVKTAKHASNTAKTVSKATMTTHKAVHTTKITSHTAKLGKVSQTATKAATVSKVGLVISAVAIPLDIFNLIQTTGNLDKLHDDVKELEDRADHMEEDLENTCNMLKLRCKYMQELHAKLYKLYQDHQIEGIYDYLLLMYEKLGLDTPVPY